MLVGVYGTLRQGESNHGYLWDGIYQETIRLKGLDMFDYGHFPYCTKGKGTITLELYEVGRETLRDLDYLEGIPFHYQRISVSTKNRKPFLLYIVKDRASVSSLPKIQDGDWVKHERKPKRNPTKTKKRG